MRTLARIERGAQRPGPDTLKSLASALGMRLEPLAPEWAGVDDEMPSTGREAPGMAVRVLRRAAGLTMVEVAARMGISVSTLSRFERGLHAPRRVTSVGGAGTLTSNDLAITDEELADALGFDSAAELTRRCADVDIR